MASPYCRCMETGKLAFGRATAVQYLMPPGAVSEKQAAANDEQILHDILNHRGPANLVMITHDLNIADQVLEPVEMGEFFVLQPNRTDFTVIGKIELYAR